MKCLDFGILFKIISNDNLKLKDEDQLLYFINDIYSETDDPNVTYLCSLVHFPCVNDIESFLKTFDYNDIIKEIWDSLSVRLMQKTDSKDLFDFSTNRYQNKVFEPKKVIYSIEL